MTARCPRMSFSEGPQCSIVWVQLGLILTFDAECATPPRACTAGWSDRSRGWVGVRAPQAVHANEAMCGKGRSVDMNVRTAGGHMHARETGVPPKRVCLLMAEPDGPTSSIATAAVTTPAAASPQRPDAVPAKPAPSPQRVRCPRQHHHHHAMQALATHAAHTTAHSLR